MVVPSDESLISITKTIPFLSVPYQPLQLVISNRACFYSYTKGKSSIFLKETERINDGEYENTEMSVYAISVCIRKHTHNMTTLA